MVEKFYIFKKTLQYRTFVELHLVYFYKYAFKKRICKITLISKAQCINKFFFFF